MLNMVGQIYCTFTVVELYMYVRMYVHTYVHTYVRTYICINVATYVLYVNVHVWI